MQPRPAAPRACACAPIMLDVEASGFGRAGYPIEVGFVDAEGQPFCTLVRPEPHWTHWDPAAEQVHHIRRELLLDRGWPVTEVARWLNQHLRGATVYSDGWANDYSWLGLLFDAADLLPAFRLENLRRLLQEHEADRWHAVKRQILEERGPHRHRASADARVLQLTLLRLRDAATPAAPLSAARASPDRPA